MKLTERNSDKPVASLSLDLDNQWAYMKTHGDDGWQCFPSYLDLVVPRILDLLHRHNLLTTFFIVGQDAALTKNHDALRSIVEAGHEIANHSFHHEPWLHLYTPESVQTEIVSADNAIFAATGMRPKGFRGPGFSISKTVLHTLKALDYAYDASTFPTFLGPLARAYYFFNAGFAEDEREKRKQLFGSLSDGLRSLRPYEWQLENGTLLEIPVTTMPVMRTPFHLSYIMYLASKSRPLAMSYFRTALGLCRLRGISPSLLLHPLDYLGGDDVAALQYFPGMALPGRDKVAIANELFREYAAQFTVLPMGEFAKTVRTKGQLPVRPAVFDRAEVVV
jgi:hypothetical protein